MSRPQAPESSVHRRVQCSMLKVKKPLTAIPLVRAVGAVHESVTDRVLADTAPVLALKLFVGTG